MPALQAVRRRILVRLPVGLGIGADRFGNPVEVVEVGDHLDRVVDRGVVEPDRTEPVRLGRPHRGGVERQLSRVVAKRSGAHIEIGCEPIIVFGVVGEFFWCALGTEVVGVRPSSVVAIVRRRDDRRE